MKETLCTAVEPEPGFQLQTEIRVSYLRMPVTACWLETSRVLVSGSGKMRKRVMESHEGEWLQALVNLRK